MHETFGCKVNGADIERKRTDTEEIGKLSLRRAQGRLELTGWQPFLSPSTRQNTMLSAEALVLLQLADKRMDLLQRPVLGPAFSSLADRTS